MEPFLHDTDPLLEKGGILPSAGVRHGYCICGLCNYNYPTRCLSLKAFRLPILSLPTHSYISLLNPLGLSYCPSK